MTAFLHFDISYVRLTYIERFDKRLLTLLFMKVAELFSDFPFEDTYLVGNPCDGSLHIEFRIYEVRLLRFRCLYG